MVNLLNCCLKFIFDRHILFLRFLTLPFQRKTYGAISYAKGE